MKRKINWTDDLKLGIPEIDRQHKIFYQFINHLLDECLASGSIGMIKVKEHISMIQSFAAKHFNAEVMLMRDYDYPLYEEHKEKHQEILAELKKIKAKIENEDVGQDALIYFTYYLLEWFTTQTLIHDRKLADFLRNEIGFGKKLMLKLKKYFKD